MSDKKFSKALAEKVAIFVKNEGRDKVINITVKMMLGLLYGDNTVSRATIKETIGCLPQIRGILSEDFGINMVIARDVYFKNFIAKGRAISNERDAKKCGYLGGRGIAEGLTNNPAIMLANKRITIHGANKKMSAGLETIASMHKKGDVKDDDVVAALNECLDEGIVPTLKRKNVSECMRKITYIPKEKLYLDFKPMDENEIGQDGVENTPE